MYNIGANVCSTTGKLFQAISLRKPNSSVFLLILYYLVRTNLVANFKLHVDLIDYNAHDQD
jgi:hypothetical protein